jgi:hypothetical protein
MTQPALSLRPSRLRRLASAALLILTVSGAMLQALHGSVATNVVASPAADAESRLLGTFSALPPPPFLITGSEETPSARLAPLFRGESPDLLAAIRAVERFLPVARPVAGTSNRWELVRDAVADDALVGPALAAELAGIEATVRSLTLRLEAPADPLSAAELQVGTLVRVPDPDGSVPIRAGNPETPGTAPLPDIDALIARLHRMAAGFDLQAWRCAALAEGVSQMRESSTALLPVRGVWRRADPISPFLASLERIAVGGQMHWQSRRDRAVTLAVQLEKARGALASVPR